MSMNWILKPRRSLALALSILLTVAFSNLALAQIMPGSKCEALFSSVIGESVNAPIQKPLIVQSVDVKATDAAVFSATQKIGLGVGEPVADITNLEINFDMGFTTVAPDSQAKVFFGHIYKVTKLPVSLGSRSSSANAFQHPEMEAYWEKVKALGYDLVIDSSLPHTGARAYFFNMKNIKVIALQPDSKWREFRHEFQHLEFDAVIRPLFSELVRMRVEEKKDLLAALPSDIVSNIGVRKLEMIQSLIDSGIVDSLAINESLSIDAELQAMGWKRFLPFYGAPARRYAIEWQLKYLDEVARAGTMTPEQENLRRRLLRAHFSWRVYDVALPMLSLTGASAAVVMGLLH